MSKKQERKRNLNINTILKQILDQHRGIYLEDIELFTQVYYPIALLEMDLKEVTFEDFELVQLSILHLYYLGVRDSGKISSTLGIPVSYVNQVIQLMYGYGYIESGEVTQLGVKSLTEKRKIGLNSVKQRLYADALTCDLIRIQQQPFEEALIEKDYLNINIVCVPHEHGTTVEYINEQLCARDFTEYKKYKGEVLNSNVSDICNVECIDILYVNAYMMKLQSVPDPLIFINYWDKNTEDIKKRNTWQPIRIPNENVRNIFGFHKDLETYSENVLSIIEDLYLMVCTHLCDMNAELVLKILRGEYPFDIDESNIIIGRIINGIPEKISICVNENSFPIWNGFVYNFLKNYDSVKGYVCTYPKMKGLMIRFESSSSVITDLSNKIKYIERKGRGKKCIEKLSEYASSVDVYLNNHKRVDIKEILQVVNSIVDDIKKDLRQ